MNDSKKPQREHNPDKDQQPIPFDEALRRLVNTPPKHKTNKGGNKPYKAKPRTAKHRKAC